MNLGKFSSIAKNLMASTRALKTPVKGLKKTEFVDAGKKITAIQQNPETGTKWAKLAQQGHEVVQFRDKDGYVAVSVDGKVTPYKGK